MSGTKVHSIGASDLTLGESAAVAASRRSENKLQKYRQLIAVAAFVLLAAIAAVVVSIALGGEERQIADARIDENGTGRNGDVEGSDGDVGEPVPADVAEDGTAIEPGTKTGGTTSSSSKSSGSGSTQSSSGTGSGTPAVPAAPSHPVFTYTTAGGGFASDGEFSSDDPVPLLMTVGSTLTIKRDAAEKGQAPYPYFWVLSFNLETLTIDTASDVALQIDNSYGDGEDIRYVAVKPGVAAVVMVPYGPGADISDPTVFVASVS